MTEHTPTPPLANYTQWDKIVAERDQGRKTIAALVEALERINKIAIYGKPDVTDENANRLGFAINIARAALAAQVEEHGLTLKYTDKDLYDEANATIERCAQVAESFPNTGDSQSILGMRSRSIAAAIRKLKDQP